MCYVKILHFDNQRQLHQNNTKLEQYAGDGMELESLPTMIIKIASKQLVP